jgi:Family of unknown function (DUF6390)
MKIKSMDGAILSARHSFQPNRLGYCGPDENDTLFEACQSNRRSDQLVKALQGFRAAYPYLRFIAESIGSQDPFDYRAVEAYWIGNEYLQKIGPGDFYDHLNVRFRSKFPKEHIKKLFETQTFAPFPHHALHVFNAFSTMGTVPEPFASGAGSDEAVGALMDKCKISWGKVVKVDESGNLAVEYEPVVRRGGKLFLEKPVLTKVLAKVQDKSFVCGVKPGDWVSFHWGFACTTLTALQVANLRKYTLSDMAIANTVRPLD